MKYEFEDLGEFAEKIKQTGVTDLGVKEVVQKVEYRLFYYLVFTAVDKDGNAYYFQRMTGQGNDSDKFTEENQISAKTMAKKAIDEITQKLEAKVKMFNGRVLP